MLPFISLTHIYITFFTHWGGGLWATNKPHPSEDGSAFTLSQNKDIFTIFLLILREFHIMHFAHVYLPQLLCLTSPRCTHTFLSHPQLHVLFYFFLTNPSYPMCAAHMLLGVGPSTRACLADLPGARLPLFQKPSSVHGSSDRGVGSRTLAPSCWNISWLGFG